MQSPSFDTYEHIQNLKTSGFSESQAVSLINAIKSLPSQDFSHFYTREEAKIELAAFPKKEEVTGLITRQVLKEELAPFATKSELKAEISTLKSELKTEISELRSELKTEISDLRLELKTEISDLRSELKTEISDLRSELKTEISGLKLEFKTELNTSMHSVELQLLNMRWNIKLIIILVLLQPFIIKLADPLLAFISRFVH